MELFSLAGAAASAAGIAAAEETGGGLTINFFWVIVSALNFIFFFALVWTFAFKPIGAMLAARRERIEQGLKDAEQAREDRAKADQERQATLAEARREANDILARAQKVAQDTRDADIAATKAELERLRERASAEIDAQTQRALADLRAEVADLALAAAGKVVNETMTDPRQRRLVEEFLAEASTSTAKGAKDAKG